MKRILSIILSVFLFCGVFAGCYDRQEVDEQAYIIAIGLDRGKTNKLRMTLQFAVPKAIGGEGGGNDISKAVTTVTLDCSTVYSGFNIANSSVGRQISLAHAKTLIFSEEIARGGIEDLVMAIPKGREFRPTVNIVVSKCDAEEYIKSVAPQMETNPAKYFELNRMAYKYTGFTANTIFQDFYNKSKALYAQPVATLAGVSKFESSKEFDLSGSTYKEKGRESPLERDFIAGEIPKKDEMKAEIMGLAVFNGSKMIGELDGEETQYYLMVTGDYGHSYITMPDPLDKSKLAIIDVKASRKPQHNVKIVDGKPVINVNVMLEGDIIVLQSGVNYESIQKLPILQGAYENMIKEGISRFLNKTAKEYKADICSFGLDAQGKFLTFQQWEDFKWLDKYKYSTFNVNVVFKIRRPGLTVRSSPITSIEKPGGDAK